MRIHDYETYQPRQASAVALGNFDGVHLGHVRILSEMCRAAQERGLLSLVWTFREHPGTKLERPVRLITPPEARSRQLCRLGVSDLVLARFEKGIGGMEPEEFVQKVLRDGLRAKCVVCGFNYHFGKGGRGDSRLLSRLCAKEGIEVRVMDAVCLCGQPVSSTLIRERLQQGKIVEANALLGHPFSVSNQVIGGQRLARRLGFPTINQQFDPLAVVPAYGVYVTLVHLEDGERQGVTNVGIRPTVGGTALTAETHLFGFQGDLYGKTIQVDFLDMLRPERKFSSVEELAEQVRRDMEQAEAWFARQKNRAVLR